MEGKRRGGARVAGLLLGLLLIAGGVALLVAQYYGVELRFDLAQYGWPIFVILPGLALLLIGLVTDDEPGVGLAVAGSIVTTIGLILSYQWATEHWASWAYAWTLIAPTAVGAGMTLWGLLHINGRVLRGGLGALVAGIVMFLVFFGFFEGLIGIGGERGLAPLGRSALPLALIVAGVLLIGSRFWPRRRRREEQVAAWPGPPGRWAEPAVEVPPDPPADASPAPPEDVPPATREWPRTDLDAWPEERSTAVAEPAPAAPEDMAEPPGEHAAAEADWPPAADDERRGGRSDEVGWRSDG